MAKFKPFHTQVVIQPDEPPVVGDDKVILVTEDKSFYATGTVISAGSDCVPVLRGGEKVVYTRYAAVEAPFAGQGLVLVKSEQIVGQINK